MENQRSSDGASSSSTAAVDKYDVFINHRGEVKKNFASHLHRALHLRGLRPFLDQKDLQEGESFPSQLEDVIRNASVHVAVFSPKYAESRWCLHELLLMRESGAPIIPVFYHVNPADLRWTGQNKTKGYGLSLHQLEQKLRYDPATIQMWRDALSFVADINGFDLNGKFNGDEVHMIDKIVERMGKIIRKPGLHVATYPTGLEDKVTDFEATVLKQQHAGKIQVAGIVGLGGMGKTTLALELFNRMRSKYNTSSFLANVKEKALHLVQRELLRGLTKTEVDINNIYEGIGMFEKHLKSAHVWLILDDIDHSDQLDALLPVKDVFSPDSFILITSRSKDVLERSGVEQLCIYQLTGLPRQHSQLLFCSYAFRQTNPLHGFENLVDQFLQVCAGLPLALKVLGALVFAKPDLSYWDAKLNESEVQMKVSPDIKKKLKFSYDALSEEEQKIFLDIAFFFIGESKTSAITVWNESGWNGLLGLENLEGKCLVEVDDKNVIHMHDQLRDLGRQIAEEETPRRLWRPTGNIDDWLHKYPSVLTEARGLLLLPEGLRPSSQMSSWYNRLYDELYCFLRIGVVNLQLVKTKGCLLDRILRLRSPNLTWLSWRDCPYTCIPSWITTKNLRVLRVDGRQLRTLWRGESKAPLQLKELEIINTRYLSIIPESIGQLKHLERIVIHELYHRNLVMLSGFKRLPDSFGNLTNLHHMDLSGCTQLQSLPDSFSNLWNLHSLKLSYCYGLVRLPDYFGSLTNLHHMDLSHCHRLEKLPDSFGSLTNLHHMDLSNCPQLKKLPDSFGSLTNLHHMDLSACGRLESLPDSFGRLSNLHSLNLSQCTQLERLPGSFGRLSNLPSLDLSTCERLKSLPDSFGRLSNLHSLHLSSCTQLERLPDSFGRLSSLHSLDLSSCTQLETLPDSFGRLSSLHSLNLSKCTQLERLPDSFGSLMNLHSIKLSWCKRLESLPDSFGRLSNLHSLNLSKCTQLERLPDSFGSLMNLHHINLDHCQKLESLPDSFFSLSNLHSLDLTCCQKLETLPDSFSNFTNLHSLDLSSCSQLETLPDSFGKLTNLHRLYLSSCDQLERLPDSFGSLSSLEYFDASYCHNLRISSRTFENIRTLEHIDFKGCGKVEVWPWQLAHQRSLRTLMLTGTNMKKELPSRIKLPSDLEVLWIGNPLLDAVVPSLGDLRKLKELRLDYGGEVKCLPASRLSSQLTLLELVSCPIVNTSHVFHRNVQYPNLETLILRKCIYLRGLGQLRSTLTNVELRSCYELRYVHDLSDLPRLRMVTIAECNRLLEVPSILEERWEKNGVRLYRN